MSAQGAAVAHGAAGYVEGGLHTQFCRGQFLELVHSGVLAIGVVAAGSLEHGLAHFPGGAGGSIASQVYGSCRHEGFALLFVRL